LSLTTGASYF